jgi:hypothetical protein
MAEVIANLGEQLISMKEHLDKEFNVPTQELSEFIMLAGELTWMAGAVEATHIIAAQTKEGIEVVH